MIRPCATMVEWFTNLGSLSVLRNYQELESADQMALPEERFLGGEPGTGQDATVVLVPTGGRTKTKLALVHLHSHVLSTHSSYFNTCLSERWEKPGSPSTSMEFTLEVQTDVGVYFDCFSDMYSPSKSFESVKHAVELLKVASQIDFEELMVRVSRYLACVIWSLQDELLVREYAASPDFPRNHVKDLVSRLGMDENEKDRQSQLCDFISSALEASFEEGVELPALLQGIGNGPDSEFTRKVVTIFSLEAKEMFAAIDEKWADSKAAWNFSIFKKGTIAICWVLKALLEEQVAEELVESIAHLKKIPECIGNLDYHISKLVDKRKEFAELVLMLYKEAAAGRVLVQPPEKVALLANWHGMLKNLLVAGSHEQATANLFLSLPVKQQTELLKLRPDKVLDYIGTTSLVSLHLELKF